MKASDKERGWTLRRLEDSPEEKSACGSRRRLLSTGDGTSAFAHLVRIHDATAHYHARTVELYYVLEGTGTMTLDGEEAELRPGTCLEIRPGTVHAARGDVLVLVVGIPSISDEDTFPVETKCSLSQVVLTLNRRQEGDPNTRSVPKDE